MVQATMTYEELAAKRKYQREYMREWRERQKKENPAAYYAKVRAQAQKQWKNNREARQRAARKYNQKPAVKAKRAILAKQWIKENPERFNFYRGHSQFTTFITKSPALQKVLNADVRLNAIYAADLLKIQAVMQDYIEFLAHDAIEEWQPNVEFKPLPKDFDAKVRDKYQKHRNAALKWGAPTANQITKANNQSFRAQGEKYLATLKEDLARLKAILNQAA